MKRLMAALMALLMVFSLCACSQKQEQYPSAREGLEEILEGMIHSNVSKIGRQWVRYYFQGQAMDVEGLGLQEFTHILFRDLNYEILSVEQEGDTATAEVKLDNRYLLEAFIPFWGWRDAEYVQFSNYELLVSDGYNAAQCRYTTQVKLEMKYEETLVSDGETLMDTSGEKSEPISAWTIVCNDDVINAFYSDVLKTDFTADGNKFLVKDATFAAVEQLAGDMAAEFTKLNTGTDISAAKARLQELCRGARYQYLLLTECYSAWDYTKSDSAIALLEGLLLAAEDCLHKDSGFSLDLDAVVHGPLQKMQAA